jgi:hypothetical protein
MILIRKKDQLQALNLTKSRIAVNDGINDGVKLALGTNHFLSEKNLN